MYSGYLNLDSTYIPVKLLMLYEVLPADDIERDLLRNICYNLISLLL